jgi:hypothetical protein
MSVDHDFYHNALRKKVVSGKATEAEIRFVNNGFKKDDTLMLVYRAAKKIKMPHGY